MASPYSSPSYQQNTNVNTSAPSQFRVGGSAFTIFHLANTPVAYAQTTALTSPQPVAAPVAIQPIDARTPIAIITPAAITGGTLTIVRWETYGAKVWDDLMYAIDQQSGDPVGTNNRTPGSIYNDLADVFIRISSLSTPLTATRFIFPPNKAQTAVPGSPTVTPAYADTYHGVVISDIRDDEQIEVGSMDMSKATTFQYTYSLRHSASANGSKLSNTEAQFTGS